MATVFEADQCIAACEIFALLPTHQQQRRQRGVVYNFRPPLVAVIAIHLCSLVLFGLVVFGACSYSLADLRLDWTRASLRLSTATSFLPLIMENMAEGAEEALPGAVHENEAMDSTKRDSAMICRGFGGLIDCHSSCRMKWYCAPDSWKTFTSPSSREGRDGSWSVDANGARLNIKAPVKKDYWRKTYYDPAIIKDDAPFAYTELEHSDSTFYTITTSFTLDAVRQFDQAGIMVRLDRDHWLKTGIEVVDSIPRLSVVVTNVYSDWSTQRWDQFHSVTMKHGRGDITATRVPCRIRVHIRGNDFVVEGYISNAWEMIRIAHMNFHQANTSKPLTPSNASDEQAGDSLSEPPIDKIWAGVFAACPEDQQGAKVVFDEFMITTGSHFEHNADGNA